MIINARKNICIGVCVIAIWLSGCATVSKSPVVIMPVAKEQSAGVYHKVMHGETLWRIARMYGLDVDSIAIANNIQAAKQLELGQLLLIPGAIAPKTSFEVIPEEEFLLPVKGRVILGFGQNGPSGLNKGLNILPDHGQDVIASRSGMVVFYNDHFLNFGKTVIIDHKDGFLTVYAGDMNVLVKLGQDVTRGLTIAQVVNGAVHFEIRKSAISQNPNFYLSH